MNRLLRAVRGDLHGTLVERLGLRPMSRGKRRGMTILRCPRLASGVGLVWSILYGALGLLLDALRGEDVLGGFRYWNGLR
jgi:hypothetical protein